MESEFIKQIPKIELHAHLNGSLNAEAFSALNALNGCQVDEHFYQILSTDPVDLKACFSKFKYAHELTQTVEAVALATEMVIATFYKENVIYLELRTTPRPLQGAVTCEDYLRAVISSIIKCRTKYPNILVKLLPSIDRSKSCSTARDNIAVIIEMKKEYPDVVCGVDFSGSPTEGVFEDFKPILERARSNGLKLALHCGEVENQSEIEEMLQFGMDRLGHGTFIRGKQFEMLKVAKIPVECCLSSNVLSKTVKAYDDHHFKDLFNINHPVVISTDDLGVFNTTLSKELLIAQNTFDLAEKDLIQLIENAIQSSFASDVEKEIMSQNVSELPTKMSILEAANVLLQRFEKDLKKMESSVDYKSDHSVYTGSTGVVALYWLIANVNVDEDFFLENKLEGKQFMEKKAQKQKEAFSRIEACLPRLKPKGISFLAGDAGPLALAVIMYHKVNQHDTAKRYWNMLLELGEMVFRTDDGHTIWNEILYGRAGYLYSLLLVRKYVPDVTDDSFIKKVVDRLIYDGKKRENLTGGILYYEWHDSFYLGAAHGIAGIMYILLKAHTFMDSSQVVDVRTTIDWLQETQFFKSGNLRSSLGSNDDKLVHWCHGAPGAIYMFIEAHTVFGAQEYLDAAIKSADVIWERGILKRSYSLCHGVSGNAYALMSIYEKTKNIKYLHRALLFARWCFDYGTKNTTRPDRPLSLFEGLAGVLYMLYDFVGSSPKFPAFEL
ncbi:Adenosine deaminase-like protein [Pseudolycoriella hygida]|uniref:Adenosine deaminase-like protein n=1 Tax=Pseudolycoriella hygida TaxID=35572 RepID=A0A9Q0N4L0_9DIPT|nr:Adenosine deaminase-like protein [Pseudolycoriella hygida]